MIFDLAFVVACVGLIYRYLTHSTARLYAKTLKDALGPWADDLLGSSLTADLRIRAPFQFTNILLPRLQLPMSREEFVTAFERVAPGMYGEALGILSRPAARAEWKQFVGRLREEGNDSSEAEEIRDIIRGIEGARQNKSGESFEANGGRALSQIRAAIWRLFPDVNDLISGYGDFLAKFDYANRRRNLRQLITLAGLLTFGGNLTLARLSSIDALPAGISFFDTHVARAIPGMLWHRDFLTVLSYLAWCVLPTLTIAGAAAVIDRKLLGAVNVDFAESPKREPLELPVEKKAFRRKRRDLEG